MYIQPGHSALYQLELIDLEENMKSSIAGLLCVFVVLLVELAMVVSLRETCDQKLRREGVIIEHSESGTLATIFDTADHKTIISALLCKHPDIERIHFDIPPDNRMWEWIYEETLLIKQQYCQAFPQTVFRALFITTFAFCLVAWHYLCGESRSSRTHSRAECSSEYVGAF